MTSEKRNQYLDAGDSEDDESQGYDSDAAELKKGSSRSSKRRKLDQSEDEADEDLLSGDELAGRDSAADVDDEDEYGVDEGDGERPSRTSADEAELLDHESPENQASKPSSTKTKPVLKRKNLIASEAAIRKSGVVYLSRIPPFMKPAKLRHLLEPFGTLNRMFLAPEDPAAHARRVKAGGNKKRTHTEGWVEFVNKKEAKKVCGLLNGRPIGGKKGSYYRDDIWNLLYLKGFKWHNLTEQIAAENAERASRMRAEISRTTKENKEFVKNVEKAKMLGGMEAKAEEKKKKRREAADDSHDAAAGRQEVVPDGLLGKKGGRSFKQIPLAKKRDKDDQPEDVRRVLSKIF